MKRTRWLAAVACAAVLAAAVPVRAGLLDEDVYMPLKGHPVALDRVNFVAQLAAGAQQVSRETGIPAAVLIAQAARESGWGWTKLSLAAANVFSVKTWGPPEAATADEWWPGYELIGQPEEDPNNHYRIYRSLPEAIRHQGIFLTKPRYQPALQNYKNNIANGMSHQEASFYYARDLRLAGYAADPDYETAIRRIMNNYVSPSDEVSPQFNLYQYNLENGSTYSLNMVPMTVVNPTVRMGDEDAWTGGAVSQLQRLLGLYMDGKFSEGTRRALVRWQQMEGLSADGVAGPLSWVRLTKAPTPVYPYLRPGDTDEERRGMVSVAQELLGLVPDGQFGPSTADALAHFQARLGIESEPGVIGRVTWTALWSGALPADNIAPKVAFKPPYGPGAGGVMTLVAEARDDVAIDRVEFRVDGELEHVATRAPYEFEWDTRGVAEGRTVEVTATAVDEAGNTAATGIRLMVNNRDGEPPRASLSLPGDATVVAGMTPLYITATDNVAVKQVDCFANGDWIGRAKYDQKKDPPYSCNWDTRGLPNGTRVSLTARVQDFAGNVATAGPVTVTVDNNDGKAPSAWVSSPSTGDFVRGRTRITAGASDDRFVSKVELYIEGWRAKVWDRPPYVYNWNPTAERNGVLNIWVKAYDAAGNSSVSEKVRVTLDNPDPVAPTVALSSPAPGATVGGTVILKAAPADYQGVTRTEFWVDGTLLKTVTAAPYEAAWDTSRVADGTHHVTVKAYDAKGNEGTSRAVPLTVRNGGGPAVTLNSPGAVVRGSVWLGAEAQKASRVEFYANGSLVGTARSAPYGVTWDTAGLENGVYTLEAKAYDSAGRTASSGRVRVTVANSGGPEAGVVLAAPAENSTVRGTVALSAPAYSPAGISRVEFYVGSYKLKTVSRAPFTANWDSTSAPNGSRQVLTARAYDHAGRVYRSNRVTVTVQN